MTATPIPRTLALTLHGDLDVSVLDELPPGRRPVVTRARTEARRAQIYAFMRDQLRAGRQAYVVYPLVEERAASDLRAASQMARHLQTDVFPEARVGLLHGRLRPADKERIMRAFAAGEVDLLVSTIIVEVGLDVPNATVMVIEHPERFGLAQLHQLRGRIGRGRHPATCVLVGDPPDAGAAERLTAFLRLSDGFELAEVDLEQRGPGELLGRRQHGWLRFRIADLLRDRALLDEARQDAAALVQRDPALAGPELAGLRERLARLRRS
jgi:ATP-dependent DNA helicase RecG